MKLKKIVNVFIGVYIIFLFIYSFLTSVEIQSSQYIYNYDQARDTYVSYFINRYHVAPQYPPWGSFRKEYHLKNNKIYYYLLAPFSFTNDGSSLLYFCSFWFVLVIPLVFILTSLISNKYAGVLAATIIFQSGFIRIVSGLPLQPLFTPTILLIFLIFLVLAKKYNSIWYFLFSSITLFLGIQFHLSFLRFVILYLWVFLGLFKAFKLKNRMFLVLISLIILSLFLFLNTDFFDEYSITGARIQMVSYKSFKEILLGGLMSDYMLIFGKNLVFLYLFLFFLIINLKKFKYNFLFFAFLFYPISAIDSLTGLYTSPYIPFFIVLFSSIVLGLKNKFLFVFILLLVIILRQNKIVFKNIKLMNPIATSQIFLNVTTNDLNPIVRDISNNCVFRCDGSIISFNVAYNFYKIQLGQSKESFFDSVCDDDSTISNDKENFLHSFSDDDCKLVFENENNRQLYNFEKIYSKDGRSIYSITRK